MVSVEYMLQGPCSPKDQTLAGRLFMWKELTFTCKFTVPVCYHSVIEKYRGVGILQVLNKCSKNRPLFPSAKSSSAQSKKKIQNNLMAEVLSYNSNGEVRIRPNCYLF